MIYWGENMGYRMEYGSWNRKSVYKQYNKCGKRYGVLLLIPVLVVAYFYKTQIINYLIPGDPKATKKAVSTFVSEMKAGESVSNAFGAFCEIIIDESGVS